MQRTVLLLALSFLLVTSSSLLPKQSFAAPLSNSRAHPARLAREQVPTPPTNPAFLTGPTPGDPLTVALNYLHQRTEQLGLAEADLADVVVKDRYLTKHNGVTHIYFRQRYKGIEVFNGDLNVHISRQGEIIQIGNRFVSNLVRLVNTETPTLAAREAIGQAARQLQLKQTAPLQAINQVNGPAQRMTFTGAGLSTAPIPVQLMYQRQPNGQLRLVWQMEIRPSQSAHWWNLRVDAVDGAVVAQNDWVVHERWGTGHSAPNKVAVAATAARPAAQTAQANTYRIFALPLESPQDGPSLPASHTLVNDPADPDASPYGWHDVNGAPGAEFHDTRGNNVSAQEDADADDADGFRPSEQTPGLLDFDYAFNPAQSPTAGTNQAAAIVNLFYANNMIHDLMVHYGFDEAAGNFQANNYSGDGLGGDAVQADAQDGLGLDNANFATPPDGEQPRMQMYKFDLTNPLRDGDLDNGVIVHEYGHGISTRLTGGPANSNCLDNAEQMGEGWSDWFALVSTAKPGDTATQARSMGTYVLGQPPTAPGIRRVPYSTDFAIDPQTYATLKASDEVHDVGEVWTSMLWEMYWGLVNKHGFDPDLVHGYGGNNLALQLVIDGLKFQPCSPGFVDGRDAILAADQVDTNGANQCTIWAAFAKRGLGFSADQGSADDTTDGTAAFDLPPTCANTLYLRKTANPPIASPGEVITYTLVATNYTTRTLTGVTLHDAVPLYTAYVAASDSGAQTANMVNWSDVTLAPAAVMTRTLQVQLDAQFPLTPTTPAGPVVTNTAYVTANEGDAYTATVQTLVVTPPTNDDIANATVITDTSFIGEENTTKATAANADPVLPCGPVAANAQTIWYQFTAPGHGRLTFERMDGNYATVLGVWHGAPGDLTNLSCDIDSSQTNVEPHEHYYLEVARLAAQGVKPPQSALPQGDWVQIHVNFNPLPLIRVDPPTFTETLRAGEQTTRTLTIRNLGSGVLGFALSKAAPDQAPWLAFTPVTGTVESNQAQSVVLTFNAGAPDLAQAGDYTATLLVASNDPDQPNWAVPLAFHVDGPTLTINDNDHAYSGRVINVPLTFNGADFNIAATVFALEYNSTCLHLDPADNNHDGAPDAVNFTLPPNFSKTVRLQQNGASTKLSISVTNATLPLVTLPDGPLAALTFTVQCQPTADQATPILFAHTPLASFGNTHGEAVAGLATGGSVTVHPDALGDVNHDGHLNAGDLVALLLEIFDGDGNFWLDAPGGSYPGSPQGGDANKDAVIDAGDIICTVLMLFDGPGACDAPVNAADAKNAPAATLTLPETVTAQTDTDINLPLLFKANGNRLAAAIFVVRFDPKLLAFDPADQNKDGIPDAVTLNLGPAFTPSVTYQAEKGELQFALFDMSVPLDTLPDGLLATIRFHLQATVADATTTTVYFPKDFTPSAGNERGQSVKLSTSDGSVTITQPEAPPINERSYLPLITR
ncbi:MAG: M36 family metallopeptidase [Caldilineaceae bacterium]